MNHPDYEPAARDADAPARRFSIFKPRLKRPSFVLSVLVNAVRILMILLLLAGLAGVGAVLGIAKAYVETAPTLDLTLLNDQDKTSFIYDANGVLITDYKGTENRVMVSIDKMPVLLRHAFVAVEDARFYTHNGVDLKRILGAFIQNFLTSSQQGGSTITQQLIKNTVLSSEQSYKRKIQEAYLAMQLETQYTKDEILQCYLNTIYLGENYYGVQVAAEGYFGKTLDRLTLRECAMLAGLTNNPYYYNPRRNFYVRDSSVTDYQKLTNNRTDYVLRCMYEAQFITREQYVDALNEGTASVLKESPTASTLMYPYAHFVEYAISEVVDIFLQVNGLTDTSENRAAMEYRLRTGGYRVTLTIDTQIQTIVENTLESYSHYPSLRDPSDKVYRARNADGTYTEVVQPQAAAVVLDYRTGELKAIVGGRTKPTQKKTLNRATDMKMPIGSSIKPIAVYAPAIELGASPASIAYNMPVPISGWKNSKGLDGWPQNYGGGYKGPETFRYALKNSHNTATAQILMNYVSVERSVDFLLRMGVDRKNIDATPFGVSLGSSGITPVQLSVAFGVLGNGGVYQSPISVLGISDSDGNVVWDGHQSQTRRQVFKPSTAYLTIDMLKDAVSGGTGTKAKISGQTVAGKTGTNSDQKGVTFCGMTGWYVSALWIGHDNYKALSSKATGGNAAAPLWQIYMKEIHSKLGLSNRDILQGGASDYKLRKVTTCAVSGQLATSACKNDAMGYGTVTDYWAEGTEPQLECQMHKLATICTDSNQIAGEYCPAYCRQSKGVINIPKGHPLYNLVGSSYDATLCKYFGDYATLTFTNDPNYNSALIQRVTCELHSEPVDTGGDPTGDLADDALLSDAPRLLSMARALLDNIGDVYGADELSSAIDNLDYALSNTPSTAVLAQAMFRVTQAMANVQ